MPIPRYLIPLALAFPLLTSACSLYRVQSEDISPYFHAPKASADEVVYIEHVDRPHEIIGFVTVNAERNRPLSEVIEMMKAEAAEMGADAITDITSDATGTWKRIPLQKILANAYVRANFTATMVVFKDK